MVRSGLAEVRLPDAQLTTEGGSRLVIVQTWHPEGAIDEKLADYRRVVTGRALRRVGFSLMWIASGLRTIHSKLWHRHLKR